MFFDTETRKKNTNIVVNYLSSLLNVIPLNDYKKGILLIIVHLIILYIIISNVIIHKTNEVYYIFIIAWLSIIYFNYYFHGCFMVKIERKLLNNKSWYGPITLLSYPFSFFIEPNKENLNNITKYLVITPITCISIYRLIKSGNKINYIIAFIILLFCFPLLFVHPQKNIFELFMNYL